MLVSSKKLIFKAQKEKYALGAFNFSNLETLKAIIAAAQMLKSPIILSTTEKAISYAGLDFLFCLASNAVSKSSLPIALHLDHGKSISIVRKCLEKGYTSVMIDGSHLPFSENIALTKKVVALAHKNNVPVEGELGQLGVKSFTKISQVKEFVEKTGVDFLAVAIGSAHGVQKEEKLNLNLLEQITKITSIPLVLHGGSGVSKKDIKEAIKKGICKINIDTDIRIAFKKGLKEGLKVGEDYRQILKHAMSTIQKDVAEKIKLFGSANKT